MKINFKRGEAAGLVLAAVGTLIAAATDHPLGEVIGGLCVLFGAAGLVHSVRGKRAASPEAPSPRVWRAAACAFALLTLIGVLLFCSQFAVGLRPAVMWSAIVAFLAGLLGLMVVLIRSLWLLIFSDPRTS